MKTCYLIRNLKDMGYWNHDSKSFTGLLWADEYHKVDGARYHIFNSILPIIPDAMCEIITVWKKS